MKSPASGLSDSPGVRLGSRLCTSSGSPVAKFYAPCQRQKSYSVRVGRCAVLHVSYQRSFSRTRYQSRKTIGVLRPLILSSILRANMDTPIEVDKASNSFDERANELVTTKPPTWLTKITNFIAQWDVETSGLVTLLGSQEIFGCLCCFNVAVELTLFYQKRGRTLNCTRCSLCCFRPISTSWGASQHNFCTAAVVISSCH